MTWWREQVANQGVMYAVGAFLGAVLWMIRTVFRNQMTVQYQAEQIKNLREELRDLHDKLDKANDKIFDLHSNLVGSHGSKPHITPKSLEPFND